VPGRADAGYAFLVTAQAKGVPDGTKAVVELALGRKVSGGRVKLSVGNCSGSAVFTASRAG
jgi:hypothetical protein